MDTSRNVRVKGFFSFFRVLKSSGCLIQGIDKAPKFGPSAHFLGWLLPVQPDTTINIACMCQLVTIS